MLTIGDIFKTEFIIAGSSNGTVLLLDTLSHRIVHKIKSVVANTITSLNVPDPTTILVGTTSSNYSQINFNKSAKNNLIHKVKKFGNLVYNLYDHSLDVTPNLESHFMALNSNNQHLTKFRPSKNRISIWRGHTQSLYSVAVSKGFCNKVLTAGYDSYIFGRSIFTMKIWTQRKFSPVNFISVIMFSPDEKKLYSCGYNNCFSVHSMVDLQILLKFDFRVVLYSMWILNDFVYVAGNDRQHFKIHLNVYELENLKQKQIES